MRPVLSILAAACLGREVRVRARAADCDAFHYASLDGSLCISCPARTRRFPSSIADVAGTSVDSCLCERGSYSATGWGGAACLACPVGGVCEGGRVAPYPQRGFYGDASAKVPSSASPLFLPCVGPRACLGGADFSCGAGWTGILCATPVEGRFDFGNIAVECPSSLNNRLRLGTRRTEVMSGAVILAALIVLLVLCSVVMGRDDTDHADDDAAWLCLQLLALAVRMRHVPWPPVLLSGLLLVADTVLLDLRPLARLALGCNISSSLPSGGDERTFFFEWTPTLAAIGLAVVVDLARRRKRTTAGHAMVLLRLYSPVVVVAICETLSCRTFPDGEDRLTADPTVKCDAPLHASAAGAAQVAFLVLALVLVLSACRLGATTLNQAAARASVADVVLLWGLAAAVTTLGDQPTEVALFFFAASGVRLVVGPWRGMKDSTRRLPDAAQHLAVAALALAALGLLFARRGQNRLGRAPLDEPLDEIAAEEWAAAIVAVVAFGFPLFALASSSAGAVADGLFLRAEVDQGALTAATLRGFETAALVVVRCHGLAAAKGRIPRDANPRLLVTCVGPSGRPLVRSSGQTNSRFLALDARDMQPQAAHCLTFALHDHEGDSGAAMRSTACFKVEVLDTTGAGVDRVVAEGTFRMNLAQETEATVSVPLRRTAHASKRHAHGSCVISCSYTIPGELLVARRRFHQSPLLHALRCRCSNKDPSLTVARPLRDHFVRPLALARYASAADRLPQDHGLLRASQEYLAPKMGLESSGWGAAAVSGVVEEMDPRFLDLLVAEAEAEPHRQALVALVQVLREAADPAKALPVDGPFMVDWLTKCGDPALLDACLDLFSLVGPANNMPTSSSSRAAAPPPVHAGKRPAEHKAEIEDALRHRKSQQEFKAESRARAAEAEIAERKELEKHVREKKAVAVASARQFAAATAPVGPTPGGSVDVDARGVELQALNTEPRAGPRAGPRAAAGVPRPKTQGVSSEEASGWAKLETAVAGFFDDAAKLFDPTAQAPLPPPPTSRASDEFDF